jgi:hypothetical protein
MSLSEQLADDDRRATIVTDAIAEVDAEVDDEAVKFFV